jgi:1-aminocyclopropane-1-carboxylate deaminase
LISYQPIIQKIESPLFDGQHLSVEVLRLDLLHPEVSGNKWFKLKLNLEIAKAQEIKTVITFGGAFSNHIAATAAACRMAGLNAVGIIRGEETASLNSTLNKAKSNGMKLHFADRITYSQKESQAFKKFLNDTFGPHRLIPEGGNNNEGVLGGTEILKTDWNYNHVLCACGTGTTYAGIAGSAPSSTIVTGISVLKGKNDLPAQSANMISRVLKKNIKIAGNSELEKSTIENSCITNNYCFKGYAKFDAALIEFKSRFESQYHIPLDHVYTSKLFYALFDLAGKKKFRPGSRILLIHSGGLQGNEGFESRLLPVS